MVDYPTFFGIVQEEASRKGLGGPGSSPARQDLTSQIGEYWSQNTQQVKGWSKAEAREWAQDNVQA